MARGRPPGPELRNSWHPSWYGFLEVCAKQVLASLEYPCGLCVEDLIAEAWIHCMRYREPEKKNVVWRYTKRAMYEAIHNQGYVESNHSIEEFDLVVDFSPKDIELRKAHELAIDFVQCVQSLPRDQYNLLIERMKGKAYRDIAKDSNLSWESIRQQTRIAHFALKMELTR